MVVGFDWVAESQEYGFIGPGDLAIHIEHSLAFESFLNQLGVSQICDTPLAYADLGTGGGFPGLFLCQSEWVGSAVLVEVRRRRAEFLLSVVRRLGLSAHVQVLCERTEVLGHTDARESFHVVTARAFGSPTVTAESASGLLDVGGVLVVSDPPGSSSSGRWDAKGLAILGLELLESTVEPFALTALRKVSRLDTVYPRRTGVPERRPLF
jgi:16S rRNA (guanine527-N7)-methyltransferase